MHYNCTKNKINMKQLRQTKPIKSHLQCPKFKDNNFPQLKMCILLSNTKVQVMGIHH